MKIRMGIAVVISLLVGLVLGRLGPQDDVRRLNERVASQQKELESRPRAGGGTMLAGVRSMFSVPRKDLEAGAQARRARAATNAPTNAPVPATNAPPGGRPSFSNHIARLKEGWLLRSAIARTNFMTRVQLDDKQQEDFDTSLEAMNLRVGETIDRWAAQVRQAGVMTPESGLRMMNEISQALLLAYDDLDRRLPQDWRQKAGPRFELMTFVDPEVLTPLQDFEHLVPPPGSP